jgi:cytidylate kinase
LKKILITIDGPAASGKEKIAKYISKVCKLNHLDSGILYRRLAQIFLVENIDISNIDKVKKKLKEINEISFRNSKKIRTQDISKLASKIAIYDCVRSFVNKLQYNFVKKNKKIRGFVIDGRDIGSVVFKKADLKLYIEVNPEIRAKRRYKQLIDSGEKSIYPKILKEIKLRDKQDKLRKHSPLIVPKGAFVISNNGTFKETIEEITKLVEKNL